MGYYDRDTDTVLMRVERRMYRLAEKFGASTGDVLDDVDVIVALATGDADKAEAIIREQYAYCDEHDEQHGVCEVEPVRYVKCSGCGLMFHPVREVAEFEGHTC